MIEDRDGKGVEALAQVTDRFLDARRASGPSWPAVFTPFSARVPQLRFDLDRTKAERLDVAGLRRLQPSSRPTWAASTSTTSTSTARSGRSWSRPRESAGPSPTTSRSLYVLNRKGSKVPPRARWATSNYTLGPIDVPHYNMYNAAKITGQPAAGI